MYFDALPKPPPADEPVLRIPERFNFGWDVVARRARETDGTAFIYVGPDGSEVKHHSFRDLDRASNRFVNLLLSLGVAPGDGMFVMIPRIPAFYETVIGAIKAGVVAMPGTNLLRPKDIAYRVEKSQAKLAIVTAEHVEKVEEVRAQLPSLTHLIVVGGEAPGWLAYEAACAEQSPEVKEGNRFDSRSDDPMLVYFTSGTTAFPKMVPRDHGYALAHALTGRYWMDLEPGDVHWTLTDTGWAKAAWGLLFPPWLAGATTLLYAGGAAFDPDLHLKLIAEHQVTTFCAPPTVYRLFAQQALKDYDLTSLRHSISAGEPLNPEVIRVWKEATGTVVHDGYGQTESVNLVANRPGLEVRPGSMGKPVPGFDVRVTDDDGNEVDVGTVGHIAVRTSEPWPPGLFRGYLGETEQTCFRNGWYFTGDTATRDEDGYIWFVGRADDIISSAGYRISPFEVESVLQAHPAVAESAVVAKPDALRGHIVKAFVVLAEGHRPTDETAQALQAHVKTQTAPYKYPREIEFRESLPKTISGKIRRVELRTEG